MQDCPEGKLDPNLIALSAGQRVTSRSWTRRHFHQAEIPHSPRKPAGRQSHDLGHKADKRVVYEFRSVLAEPLSGIGVSDLGLTDGSRRLHGNVLVLDDGQ